jgi:cytochrome c553
VSRLVRSPRLALLGALSVAGLVLLGAPMAASEDAMGGDMIVTRDMQPWEGCSECHALDGVAPNGHFPSIAALGPAYLRKQMADFRDGRRSNDHGQMGNSASEATGRVLDRIVGYFSRLPAPPPQPVPGIRRPDAVRAAQLIARGSRAERIPPCANCHGTHPKHAFDAPCLEAQPAAYTEKQLDDFKSGRRTNDPERAMQKAVARLSGADIGLLAAYLAGLPRPTGPSGTAAFCGGEGP